MSEKMSENKLQTTDYPLDHTFGEEIINLPVYSSQDALFEAHIEDVAELCSNSLENILGDMPTAVKKLVPFLAKTFSYTAGYIPRTRLAEWATKTGLCYRNLLLSNLAYECSHTYDGVNVFGCTSAALHTKKYGPVHVRNLDWPLKGMGRTTAIIETDQYVSVTNPGMVGALSGMRLGPMGYSLSLNWAPPSGPVKPRYIGPLFLIQLVLEKAETYQDALTMLESTLISTSALFTLVGTDDACVIERTGGEYHTRNWVESRKNIVVTNHFEKNVSSFNVEYDEDMLACSALRYEEAMFGCRALDAQKDIEGYSEILSGADTLNDCTVQQMVFCPAKEKYWVRAFNNDDLLC